MVAKWTFWPCQTIPLGRKEEKGLTWQALSWWSKNRYKFSERIYIRCVCRRDRPMAMGIVGKKGRGEERRADENVSVDGCVNKKQVAS